MKKDRIEIKMSFLAGTDVAEAVKEMYQRFAELETQTYSLKISTDFNKVRIILTNEDFSS